MSAKTVDESRTEMYHIVMPPDLNGVNRLFGGQLVKWIDEVAGITARRHCGCAITTASIDHLQFREPVFNNQIVVLIGKVTYVGTTSLEIRVDTFVEEEDGTRRPIHTAFLTEVAMDVFGRPTLATKLTLRTPQEEAAFEAGMKRRELRMNFKDELKNL